MPSDRRSVTTSFISRDTAVASATIRFRLLGIERLQQIVIRAQSHGFDGGLRRAVSRHDDDRRGNVVAFDFDERFQPVEAGHFVVEEDGRLKGSPVARRSIAAVPLVQEATS